METRSDYSISVDELWTMWGEEHEARLRHTPEHERVVRTLLDLYRDRGLLPDERDLSLSKCCPHRDQCWRDAPPPNDLPNSGVALPWIGKKYFDTRIVIMAINFNNLGGLAGAYWVCEDHIKSMREGKRGKDNRPFSRNAMLYLRVALASLRGEAIPADDGACPNEDLAELWESCAFVEAVKCSPGTHKSYPTASMFNNCPEFLVKVEFEVLKPSVVLLLGRSDLRDVIRPWSVPEEGYGIEEGPRMERNQAVIGGRPVTLFSLNHPSTPNSAHVVASLGQLRESVASSPLKQIA